MLLLETLFRNFAPLQPNGSRMSFWDAMSSYFGYPTSDSLSGSSRRTFWKRWIDIGDDVGTGTWAWYLEADVGTGTFLSQLAATARHSASSAPAHLKDAGRKTFLDYMMVFLGISTQGIVQDAMEAERLYDLLSHLLHPDPVKRPSARVAKAHAWFADDGRSGAEWTEWTGAEEPEQWSSSAGAFSARPECGQHRFTTPAASSIAPQEHQEKSSLLGVVRSPETGATESRRPAAETAPQSSSSRRKRRKKARWERRRASGWGPWDWWQWSVLHEGMGGSVHEGRVHEGMGGSVHEGRVQEGSGLSSTVAESTRAWAAASTQLAAIHEENNAPASPTQSLLARPLGPRSRDEPAGPAVAISTIVHTATAGAAPDTTNPKTPGATVCVEESVVAPDPAAQLVSEQLCSPPPPRHDGDHPHCGEEVEDCSTGAPDPGRRAAAEQKLRSDFLGVANVLVSQPERQGFVRQRSSSTSAGQISAEVPVAKQQAFDLLHPTRDLEEVETDRAWDAIASSTGWEEGCTLITTSCDEDYIDQGTSFEETGGGAGEKSEQSALSVALSFATAREYCCSLLRSTVGVNRWCANRRDGYHRWNNGYAGVPSWVPEFRESFGSVSPEGWG